MKRNSKIQLDETLLNSVGLSGRRHSNKTGYRQIKNGKTRIQVDLIAKRVLG